MFCDTTVSGNSNSMNIILLICLNYFELSNRQVHNNCQMTEIKKIKSKKRIKNKKFAFPKSYILEKTNRFLIGKSNKKR